jgi:hypothetical protein
MRANEFLRQGVTEGFLDKFFKPKKVKPEMIMNIKKGNGELYVEVYMGEDSTYWIARFTFDMIGDTLTAQDISVTDEYRGRGIAKWVYDTLKNKGYTINRSPYQTDDGKHFWDKNKGANAKVWEQGVAEGSEHQQQDLDDVADWMNTTPDKVSVEVRQEPIEKFIKQIREMYGTYDEFPEDEQRTNRILKLLKRGAQPLPVYVEANDPDLFVMEGRHRMVAFWLVGMKSIPVAYVSIKGQQGVAEDSEQKNTNDLNEKWSQKYKRSIDCSHPKGFSQRAHCQGRKKNEDTVLERKRKRSKKKAAYTGYGYYPAYVGSDNGAADGGGGE